MISHWWQNGSLTRREAADDEKVSSIYRDFDTHLPATFIVIKIVNLSLNRELAIKLRS